MSLQCRTCGVALPMVLLTDAAVEPEHVEQPITESIWKTGTTQAVAEARAGEEAVTVHGNAESPPAIVAVAAPEPPHPVPKPVHASRRSRKKSTRAAGRKPPTLIERLHVELPPEVTQDPTTPTEAASPDRDEQTLVDPASIVRPPSAAAEAIAATEPPVLVEMVAEPIVLNAESDSEIEVSAEAETLVEASVAPLTFEVPDEIALGETTTQIDEVATQLREGAWRSAMSLDPSTRAMFAPVLIAPPPLPARRLSMHRVALAIAAVGAVAAAAYAVRVAPGTSSVASPPATAILDAVPAPAAQPPAIPPPAAGGVVAVTAADGAQHAEPAPAPALPDEPVRHEPAPPASEVATAAASPPAAGTAVPKAPAPRRTAPVVAPADPLPRPVQARRAPVETPRPCTPAIAALGLCTLEAGPEGK